jgi:hypothetical protein
MAVEMLDPGLLQALDRGRNAAVGIGKAVFIVPLQAAAQSIAKAVTSEHVAG